jgi:hypothetical protein
MGSKWTLGIWVGGVEWIHLAQDRDRWRAVVSAVMNPLVLAPRSQSVDRNVDMRTGVCIRRTVLIDGAVYISVTGHIKCVYIRKTMAMDRMF